MLIIVYNLVQKDKATMKKCRNLDLSTFHIFINVFSNKIIYLKIFLKSFFSLIIILENIEISMLQKNKGTYEFIK